MIGDVFEHLGRCTGFQWDEGNAPKVLARHGVEPGECEQLFFIEPFLVEFDEQHSTTEQRWRALGQTTGGRGLFLVFTLRDTLIRVIAAREMNHKEQQRYAEVKTLTKESSEV
jgi:uncharacterized DUF497 family protein